MPLFEIISGLLSVSGNPAASEGPISQPKISSDGIHTDANRRVVEFLKKIHDGLENVGGCSSAVHGKSSIDQIIPGLFLGDKCAARDTKLLSSLGVTYILNATEEVPQVPAHSSMKYVRMPFVDGSSHPEMFPRFEEAIKFMDEGIKNGGVFVHCYAGMSRSASLVTAFLMHKNCWTLDRALQHVKTHRLIANPNEVFMTQLREYEQELKKKQCPQLKDN